MTDAIAFFDRLADGWDERYRKNNFRARLELLNRMVAAPQGGKLWLDAGCGTATVARWLMRERGARVVAIDASTRMLANAGRVDGSAFLCCSDATNLGVRSGVFDAVVCLSVLEYVERPPALLAELGRVLKPGGTLIISVPHAALSVELPLTV